MAEAIIDWKRIKSRFVEDDAYEHINAPQWVDLTAADDGGGDDAWFCRAGCDHPKTLESNETALQVSNHNKTMTKSPFLGLSNYVVVNQDSERIDKVGEEGIKSNTEMQETNATDGGILMMRGCLCADYLLFTLAECCHHLRKLLKKNNFT